jgi:hypothetical protein
MVIVPNAIWLVAEGQPVIAPELIDIFWAVRAVDNNRNVVIKSKKLLIVFV